MEKKFRVTLVRSLNGRLKSHIQSARCLGLRRIRGSVVVDDRPEIVGVLKKLAICFGLKMPDCLLNTLSPKPGSKKKPLRVGRGRSSGHGKTCGRGHKGQKSRSGGKVRRGFEGGQMPLQRRLPKSGFSSRIASKSAEVRLGEINLLTDEKIDRTVLVREGLVHRLAKHIKLIDSGKIGRAVSLAGIKVTRGARQRIQEAGGSIETEVS